MRFSAHDLADVAALLRDAARAEIMPRFRNLAAGEVRSKSGPLDLVTAADEAAERLITAGLRARFPGCVVVGEEAAEADKSLLGLLADADLAFVVDPIDGTANFAAGLPLFGVMVAAIRRGEVIASAIYDPMGDDTALALRGEGAWTETPSGRRSDLRVAAPASIGQMAGVVSWRFLPEPMKSVAVANLSRLAASYDYRCAAHQYRLIAGGYCHFLMYFRLLPWDHAPGWLLHREAGGYAARFDGSAYSSSHTDGGLICAPDRACWEALREALVTG
jgi:fructose-1,6-bisphosphatase/inositol monophosphatase family enzyme